MASVLKDAIKHIDKEMRTSAEDASNVLSVLTTTGFCKIIIKTVWHVMSMYTLINQDKKF